MHLQHASMRGDTLVGEYRYQDVAIPREDIAALAAVDARPWLFAALGAGILAIVLGMTQVNYLGGG